MDNADLIIDGLLGIGGRGGLREPFAGLARQAARARQAGATVVAVDLPSGIDADTGAVDGPAVRADVTVTFGVIKPGLLIDPGAGHAGAVELIDIGLGPYLKDAPSAAAPQGNDIREMLPRPGAESDKYRRGVLGLLAGSDRFTGAVLLATGGAVRGGRAWSGSSPRTSPPCWCGRPGPRPWSPCTPTRATGTCSVRSAGSRRGCWPVRAWEPVRMPWPGWRRCSARTCRCWWTRTG